MNIGKELNLPKKINQTWTKDMNIRDVLDTMSLYTYNHICTLLCTPAHEARPDRIRIKIQRYIEDN